MKRPRFLLIAAALLVALLAIYQTGRAAQSHAVVPRPAAPATQAQSDAGEDGLPDIQAPQLISIPYGFDSPLGLVDDGEAIRVSGFGGCTAGQDVTVAMTITQSSTGAMASGEWNGTCTGQNQTWRQVIFAAGSPAFETGDADATGFTTTRDDGAITGTDIWTPTVQLVEPLHLPTIYADSAP